MPVTLTSPMTLPLNFLPTVMVVFRGVDGPLAGLLGIAAFGEIDCWKDLAIFVFFLVFFASAEEATVAPSVTHAASARTPTKARRVRARVPVASMPAIVT